MITLRSGSTHTKLWSVYKGLVTTTSALFKTQQIKIWWIARDLNPAVILGASEANTPSISATHIYSTNKLR
jgi:hypothetical protein